MTIFKKISPLEGNPMRGDGTQITFSGLYYETENEADIELLSNMKQYVQVESRETEEVVEVAKKATTGVISSTKLAELAAQNK